jgi:beta-glucosidase
VQDVLLVAHNSLLAHGHAVRAIRAAAKTTPSIGWATVAHVKYPSTDSTRDVEAARSAQFGMNEEDWFWSVSWFGDPMHLGSYPEHALRMFGDRMPKIGPRDMETIHAPLDYIGLNIYSGTPFRAGDDGPEPVRHADGRAHTDMNWFVTPETMRWGPLFIGERYNVPSYITENGMANLDWITTDGAVHDPQRIDFTHRYLANLEAGIDAGADVRGYFHWSLLDNFEWGHGYKKRFGLVYIDFATGERRPKDSFEWYRNRIDAAHRGASKPSGAVTA